MPIQWQIQEFPKRGHQPSFRGGGGVPDTILSKFPENCMKLRKIWSLGWGGGGVPEAPPISATAIN